MSTPLKKRRKQKDKITFISSKKLFLPVFLFILLISAISVIVYAAYFSGSNDEAQATDAPNLQKGLIGHWTMDENDYNSSTNQVNDLSPFSNHGTNYGTIFTTDRENQANKAMEFGSSDRILINNMNIPANASICAWGYATSYLNTMLFSADSSSLLGPDLYFYSSTINWNVGDSGNNPFKYNLVSRI
jgi:hypothetical protein